MTLEWRGDWTESDDNRIIDNVEQQKALRQLLGRLETEHRELLQVRKRSIREQAERVGLVG